MKVGLKRVSLVALMILIGMFTLIVLAQQDAPPAPTPDQLQAMAERAENLGLPEGVIQISPCVPTMGEHWANPADMPLGPIYGVMGDEVVFVEIMPSQEDFAQGKSWLEVLVPVADKTIHHVDFEFLPGGHEGYEVPHYDIHAYFVPHEDHVAFCPPSQ